MSRVLVQSFLLVLMMALLCPSSEAAPGLDHKKVLLLSSVDSNLPAAVFIEQSLRSTLKNGLPGGVEIYAEYLDSTRTRVGDYEQELIAMLRRKYEGKNFDVIFTIEASALRVLLRHQHEIFQNVPIVFMAVDERNLSSFALGPNVTGVWGDLKLKPSLEVALGLQPETKNVVVVAGVSDFDKYWTTRAREEFRAFEGKLEVSYLTGLTIAEYQKALASLPPHTIVFLLTVTQDNAGNSYVNVDVLRQISQASSAPIYGTTDAQLGLGVVGGRLVSFEAIGTQMAQLGLRVLAGEQPQSIAPHGIPSVAIFDWRELRRWGIDESKLPAGSIIRFKSPTFSEQYKWHIVGVISLLFIETLLIVALLVHRSRRRQAEKDNEQLARLAKAEHQRLDEVISNVPGIVWESRAAQGTKRQLLSFVSEHVEKMLGYSVEEWLSTPGFAMTIVAEEDRERAMRESQAILESGKGGVLQFRWVTKDSRILWVESQVTVINGKEGKPIGLRGVTMDVTDRKKAEAAAIEQRSELAHLSRVTMLGELSGSLAHELNQPLMAILSNAQAAQRFLAHDNVDLDELREILTDIVDQDKRAGEVIHRLRLLLKKGEVEQQPLDVNSAVQEVLKLIRGDLLNHGVTTLTKLGPALPTVKGDRVQLQQVLLNLVMNACDAMNGNAPADRQIVVSTELSDGAGVRFSVSDRGSGLPAGELEQVFEPFFTSKTHGLGLGLSVCRSIVTAHGGKLWAANNPERGATFHFTLPLHNGSNL